ncbi:hypothetical protein MRX96_024517 [Rhipicephalus microplus]
MRIAFLKQCGGVFRDNEWPRAICIPCQKLIHTRGNNRMPRVSATLKRRQTGRLVCVGRMDHQMREARERSIHLRDRPKESRLCELSPSTHPGVQSHPGTAGCPQHLKRSQSAHHRRFATAKLPTEIEFNEAIDRYGDQQAPIWTLLFKWVEWELPRHQGSLRALQQHVQEQISMLPTFELSINRAEEPPAAGLTKGILRAFSRINFHQPAPCVLFGAKMQKGRKWLPFAISDIRSALTTHECFTVLGAETAQVWNGAAFPFVALLNQAHCQQCEHLFLAEVSLLPTHWPQRAYVSFLHLLIASRANLSRSILEGMEIAQPLVMKSPVFGSSEASRGCWQKETDLFLGCCHGDQPFVRVSSRTLVTSAWKPRWSELQQLSTSLWAEILRGKELRPAEALAVVVLLDQGARPAGEAYLAGSWSPPTHSVVSDHLPLFAAPSTQEATTECPEDPQRQIVGRWEDVSVLEERILRCAWYGKSRHAFATGRENLKPVNRVPLRIHSSQAIEE